MSFNPRVDSAYIAAHWCQDWVGRVLAIQILPFGKLLSHVDSLTPRGIGPLQRLRVHSGMWGSESKLTRETRILDVANIILRFSGLKELQLEMCDHTHEPDFPNDGSHHGVHARNLKDCRESFQDILDSQKNRFRGNKAPRVTAYIWTGDGRDPVYTPGYAYSDSTGEKWVALPWADGHEWIYFECGIDLAKEFKFAESWDAEQSKQT
jgi:hypothetical protein